MERIKYILPKISVLAIVCVLMVFSIKVDYNHNKLSDHAEISITTNKAMAKIWENLDLVREECWNDGQMINICRVSPSNFCNDKEQDPC